MLSARGSTYRRGSIDTGFLDELLPKLGYCKSMENDNDNDGLRYNDSQKKLFISNSGTTTEFLGAIKFPTAFALGACFP